MYKTVLFDLDGTLLNTIDDLADSANRVCAAHGWPQYETAQYRYFVGNGIPKLVERFSPAAAAARSSWPRRWQSLIRSTARTCTTRPRRTPVCRRCWPG